VRQHRIGKCFQIAYLSSIVNFTSIQAPEDLIKVSFTIELKADILGMFSA
jgi:hypothetical protein